MQRDRKAVSFFFGLSPLRMHLIYISTLFSFSFFYVSFTLILFNYQVAAKYECLTVFFLLNLAHCTLL